MSNYKFVFVKCLVIAAFSFLTISTQAQDLDFARGIVDTLTSSAFWGRGYTKGGMEKAGNYLVARFRQLGLIPMDGKDFKQGFSYPVNFFPGSMRLEIDGIKLKPGEDFIVSPESKGIKAHGEVFKKDSAAFADPENKLLIVLKDKLTWSVAQQQADYTMISVDRKKITSAKKYKINIEAAFDKNFEAFNVCGMVKGSEKPDSFIFITAHYDHLGGMGKDVYFPGANDNASGISLLLNLARYYAEHPAKYSIGFICFAGEEAGLVGSDYFVKHPLIDLHTIRFLINTDLAGTGEEGITVVNATEYPIEFAWLQEINETAHLLAAVNPRGKAANSDHYFFTEAGVPAFFFYTLGGIKAYHDVFDKAATLPLNEHEDLFKLLIAFNKRLMAEN